ncbi:MAG: methyltransferase domain-containing protein [Prevotellaceae bacterium]|nr:methyltransferase domain-containing protein [Prevotellaceae bacterium]
MNRINLMDVDFIIPVRIDSVVRIENLLSSIDYLLTHFHTNIFVIEATHFNNHILEKSLPNEVVYFFIEDLDPIFHRTKYLNILSRKGIGKYIAIWDADIIINYRQIVESVTALREETADVSFPYDGHFYDTTEIIRSIYLETSDYSVLNDNINKMLLPYGTDMGGGAVFIARNKFNMSGGEDESFYGWGPEDWNRIEKWKKYGYNITKIKGPLFHLSHPRDINGKLNSEWQTRHAYNTLTHTQFGSIEEIKKRVRPVVSKRTQDRTKLHIGCGGCLLPSWINTDIKPNSDEVLYLDITKPFPFVDNSFEFVFAEHVCEHISFDAFLSSLHEIIRVLKPGGIFRLAMPTLDFLLALYENPTETQNSKYINWSTETFSSKITTENHFDLQDLAVITFNNFIYNWGHKFIYSIKMIENTLTLAGFMNIERCAVGVSNHIELNNLEQHGTQIPSWANEIETVVFEAKKCDY